MADDVLKEIKAQNIYGLTVDPARPGHVLAATNQTGMFPASARWRQWGIASLGRWRPDVDAGAHDLRTKHRVRPAQPARALRASTQTSGVLRSTDGRATFSLLNVGLTTLRTSRAAGVVIDPRDSQVLYVATEGGGVFKSRNGGATWFPINQGLTNLNVFAPDIDPRDPNVLYAGGGGAVYKTTTGGEGTINSVTPTVKSVACSGRLIRPVVCSWFHLS